MRWRSAVPRPTLAAIMICNLFFVTRAFAADISGQVLGAGAPIAQSTVTLLAASEGHPNNSHKPKPTTMAGS